MNYRPSNYYHTGNAGDIVASLALVQANGGGNYYVHAGLRGFYAPSINHPWKDKLLPLEFAEQLLPLIDFQPYIKKAKLYEGEEIDLHLDAIRSLPVDFRMMHLARVYHYLHPVPFDLSQPWLFVNPREHDYLVVNRTNRYHNPAIDYSILRGKKVLFIGLEEEYQAFEREYEVRSEFTKPKTLLEAAEIIAGGVAFVGNQSCCWWISEGLKCPRILECFVDCPNSSPVGGNAVECVNQACFRMAISALL